MVMLPDCVPAAAGVNVTLMEQLAFTASVEGLTGQLFVCENCALAAMLVMLSAAVPVLVSVTDCDVLVVFTGWLGKVRLVGDRVTGMPKAELAEKRTHRTNAKEISSGFLCPRPTSMMFPKGFAP